MGAPGQPKTGGRQAGTPNKATAEFKAFLDEVFAEALLNPAFRTRLVAQITELSLDTKLFQTLLAYWAGAPPKAIELKARGTTFADLVLGNVNRDGDQESTH